MTKTKKRVKIRKHAGTGELEAKIKALAYPKDSLVIHPWDRNQNNRQVAITLKVDDSNEMTIFMVDDLAEAIVGLPVLMDAVQKASPGLRWVIADEAPAGLESASQPKAARIILTGSTSDPDAPFGTLFDRIVKNERPAGSTAGGAHCGNGPQFPPGTPEVKFVSYGDLGFEDKVAVLK